MSPVTDVRRSVVAYFLIVWLCCPVQSTLTLRPDGTVAHYIKGETATLTCHTTLPYPVLWQYSKDLESARYNVFRRGLVINGFRNRTTADQSVPNTYTIQIRDLQLSDSGIYRCLEDDGIGPDEKYVEVIVHEEQTTVAVAPVERQHETYSYLATIADKPSSQGGQQRSSNAIVIAVVCVSVVLVIVVVVLIVIVFVIQRRHHKAPVQDDVEKTLQPKIYRPQGQGQTPASTAGESNSLTASDGSSDAT